MKGCVAITRDGLGDIWRFQTFTEADRHPVVQYGDPIIDGPEKITKQIAPARLPKLMRRIGADHLAESVEGCLKRNLGRPHRHLLEEIDRIAPHMWQRLLESAAPPPEDPSEVVKLIRRDRQLSVEESKTMDANTPTNAAATEAKKAPKAKPDGKAPVEKKARQLSGHAPSSTIHFGVDKEGKKYGPENNPKREGSASADRFNLYKEGMTIEQALTAGIKTVDIGWDLKKGFIEVKAVA